MTMWNDQKELKHTANVGFARKIILATLFFIAQRVAELKILVWVMGSRLESLLNVSFAVKRFGEKATFLKYHQFSFVQQNAIGYIKKSSRITLTKQGLTIQLGKVLRLVTLYSINGLEKTLVPLVNAVNVETPLLSSGLTKATSINGTYRIGSNFVSTVIKNMTRVTPQFSFVSTKDSNSLAGVV